MSKRQMLRQAKIGRLLSRRFLKPSLALWFLFLLPLLTACASTTTQYVQVPVTPIPLSLLQACLPSPLPSDPITYGDSVLWNELLLTDLQNCNSQIAGIKQIEEARQK